MALFLEEQKIVSNLKFRLHEILTKFSYLHYFTYKENVIWMQK